jgi:hypothetical protein
VVVHGWLMSERWLGVAASLCTKKTSIIDRSSSLAHHARIEIKLSANHYHVINIISAAASHFL